MEKLPILSYSRMDTFLKCPMKYKLRYIDKNFESSEAIHLDLGNIIHKVLEIKYRKIINNEQVNYEELLHIADNGIAEDTEKDKGKFIIGINEIREKYGNEAFEEIDKNGLNYNDKLETFYDYLKEEVDKKWKPIAVEQEFEFVFDNRVIFKGFIDRIDQNSKGDLRVIDYKTSKKLYRDSDLKTPLQMVIYALACENIYNKLPTAYQYDMVLLGEKQDACSKGFYKRGVRKIHSILDELNICKNNNDWRPKPTPLCHWCEFSCTNPNIPFYYEGLCEYYSLWTPENKTFKTNKLYVGDISF